MDTVIWIEAAAPTKPPEGAACNGCGVCCSLEPCPIGVLLSWRTRGACRALRWQAEAGRYVCGALSATASLRWPLPWLHAWLRRRIAAGDGCDCTVELATVPPTGAALRPTPARPPGEAAPRPTRSPTAR